MIFKCDNCNTMIDAKTTDENAFPKGSLTNLSCPVCGKMMVKGCGLDCECSHQNVPGIKVCPECGEYVCPDCGGHDVIPHSRVTGYLSPVSSYNEAKKQEVKDRVKTQV